VSFVDIGLNEHGRFADIPLQGTQTTSSLDIPEESQYHYIFFYEKLLAIIFGFQYLSKK